MSLKIYDRQVSYEVAYVRIDADNSVADLANALDEFGSDGATWVAEPNYIVLSREMGTVEVPAEVRSTDTAEGGGMSDEELLETYRASVNKAMDEAYARDGFASNMSRESIVAGLRAVFDIPKGEGN